MKMIQIYLGTDQQLFGLDEFGKVYVYTREHPPHMHQEPEYRAVTRPEWEAQQAQAQNQAIDAYYRDRMLTPAPVPVQMFNERHLQGAPDFKLNQQQMLAKGEMLTFQGYKNVYTDGCTEGWVELKMIVSKPVPHPDDPTKSERS